MADTLPDLADIEGIVSPVERARVLTTLSRRFGTLPTPYAKARDRALAQARDDEGRRVVWIAERVGLTPSRISQLANRAASALAGEAAAA